MPSDTVTIKKQLELSACAAVVKELERFVLDCRGFREKPLLRLGLARGLVLEERIYTIPL